MNPAIQDWHLEVERRIGPNEPGYAGYSGTDGRDVFIVYCHPPWIADDGYGRHIPICADDEADAKRRTLPLFHRLPAGAWDWKK